MEIMTAEQFVAQGTTPGQILSIAAHNQRIADAEDCQMHHSAARQLRFIAREVGVLSGYELPKRPNRRKKAANNNKRSKRAA